MTSAEYELVEYEVFAAALVSRSAAADLITRLGTYKWLSPELDFFWQVLVDTWRRHGEAPTLPILTEALVRHVPHDLQEVARAALDRLIETPPTTAALASCEILRRRAVEEGVLATIEDAAKKLELGLPEESAELLARSALQTRPAPRARSIFDGGFGRPDRQVKIPTGITELDRIIGGIVRGETGQIIGLTGSGKSTLVTEIGFGGVVRRKRVLHIDTENGFGLVRARYVARFTGIPVNVIRSGQYTPAQRRLLQAWQEANQGRLDDYLQVIQLEYGESTFDDAEAAVQRLIADGFRPDLAIFDCWDHLAGEREYRENWQKLEAHADRAKRFSRRYDFGCWGTSQGDAAREGKVLSNAHFAGRKHKANVAGVVVSINHLAPPGAHVIEDNGERMLYVPKNREGGARAFVPVRLDGKICRVYCDYNEEHDEFEQVAASD